MSENLLARETSPYLLQHRDNPVHWRAWGPEALAEAARLDRPILLSIGYAACHWCHVMAHESFEDEGVAALMNELFVNIKVDREERPDIDTIYQHALALMSEQGGWPLTMFCTPQGEPFWGGTYFPPEPRYGRPGFKELLRRVAEIYREEKDTVLQNVDALRQGLARLSRSAPGELDPAAVLVQAAGELVKHVDMEEGGIGTAPKFPQTPLFKLFWRAGQRTGQERFRDAVLVTLTRMCQGGIYDHLGGGFARYSTDAIWLAPHFEKMLYDNAQLLELLSDAWLATRDPLYEARVRETVAWILREMVAEGGGFAATIDADSEGHEGRFYVWSAAEIDRLLGEDAALFKRVYDVRAEGNWEGSTILNRSAHPEFLDAADEERLARCRSLLFAARERRIRPGWDDKVLADWNGLMIASLAEAALVFDEPPWLEAGERAFAFVAEKMSSSGRLFHSYRAGQLKHKGGLDDYAAMMRAAVALHEATGTPAYLAQAEAWAEALERHFADAEAGGYFATADDVDDVIVRVKSASDNATPAGNALVVEALARLHYLTAKPAYRTRAAAVLRAFAGQLERNVFSLASLLDAADFLAHATQVVLVGQPGDPGLERLRRAVYGAATPTRLVQLVAPGEPLAHGHPAEGKGAQDGKATAYVCTGMTCSLPITNAAALGTALQPLPWRHHA
ncbi:MAG TPA: thioredoxin domain-containing protein [Alphaproteobacteria bacterium]|nr:thioredoxin domain-containing protein [Alphaproteobacteria bacterium]